MDEVLIYDRLLASGEVRKLYTLGRGGIFELAPNPPVRSVPAVAGGGLTAGSLALLGVGV